MKKTAWIAIVIVVAAAVAALAQEAPDASKAKPSAARVATNARTHTSEPQPMPAATTSPAPTETATLPVGTTVRMKLETMLSTNSSKRGDDFAGRVTEAVVLDGKTVIPVGASVTGHIMRSDAPRRIKGSPVIDLRPEAVTMPNGDQFAMRAYVVDTSDPRNLHVDEEGAIHGNGSDSTDLVTGALGVGGGMLAGSLVNGFKGLAVGAGIGGGAAFVRWMTRRHSETIPAGTELWMELSRPMSMSMSGAAGR